MATVGDSRNLDGNSSRFSDCERFRPSVLGRAFALPLIMVTDKRFVYILRSCADRTRYYAGLTSDVQTRLSIHNSGGSVHTCALRPWQLVVTFEFANQGSAVAFEQYLKTGSGRAFAKRHFI
jgi:putative endonuclease